MATGWTCPFCNGYATIRSGDFETGKEYLEIDNADGLRMLKWDFIVCPNPECRGFSLSLCLYAAEPDAAGRTAVIGEMIQEWSLIPSSKAKTFPSYVPKPIIDDYNEACLIVDLSPKASATLSRRCLQGMIRDFFGIQKSRLKDEIDELKGKVEPEIWDAIQSVRTVGNIGAHMEKDINVIVDVDPKEAELLIELIELLIKECYIARENRKKRLEEIRKLGESKDKARKGQPPS